jgi:hypothetical protein
MPQMGYDTKTDWLTDCRNVTLTAATGYQSLPLATTSTRQQQGYVSSKRLTTCPASAEPARALPTGVNLRSAAFTADTTHRQPSADQLGQLPARCPPNPACCGPGNLLYTLWPLSGPPSTVPANQHGLRRGPPHCIRSDPLQGHRLKQCQYGASAP